MWGGLQSRRNKTIATGYLESVKNLQKSCSHRRLGLIPDGVVTCGVEVSPSVAAIAEHFNLPGVPIEVAEVTTNKEKRSRKLRASGVLIPKFEALHRKVLPNLSFPFVVKPSDSSGSRGVRQVRTLEDFDEAYTEAKDLSTDGVVICEELLAGVEVSIEGFVDQGVLTVTGVAERHFLAHEDSFPYFLEWGGTMPPYFSKDLIQKCCNAFKEGVDALGIKNGPTKGDLLISAENDVYILEITSRTSPGFAADMQPLQSGVEPLKALLMWAVGNEFKPYLTPKFSRGVAHRYLLHTPGTVTRLSGLGYLTEQPGVERVLQLKDVQIGDRLGEVSYMNRISRNYGSRQSIYRPHTLS